MANDGGSGLVALGTRKCVAEAAAKRSRREVKHQTNKSSSTVETVKAKEMKIGGKREMKMEKRMGEEWMS